MSKQEEFLEAPDTWLILQPLLLISTLERARRLHSPEGNLRCRRIYFLATLWTKVPEDVSLRRLRSEMVLRLWKSLLGFTLRSMTQQA